MTFCAKRNPDKLWRFAINVMSVDPAGKSTEEIIEEGITTLKEFYHDMGLTTNLQILVGQKPDIDKMVESLHRNMGDVLGAYVPLTMNDCREIYEIAMQG